jgi:hypothetical protein
MKRTCQYCGFKSSNASIKPDNHGHSNNLYSCRSETACFNRILARMRAAEESGHGMANLCFNLSQQSGRALTDDICGLMRDLCRKWDQRRSA